MRRPACIVAFAYILGCVLQYSSYVVNLNIILLFMIIIIIYALVILFIKKRVMIKILIFLCIVLIGIFNFDTHYKYNGDFEELFNLEIYITGTVLEMSLKNEERVQFVVKGKEIGQKGESPLPIGDKLMVNIKGELKNPKKFLGKKIQINGVLEQASQNKNPKMFNYRTYLKSKKIYGLIYANSDDIHYLGEGGDFFIRRWANKSKYIAENIFISILPDKEAKLLKGLLFGDKDQLDPEIYGSFRQTGTAHVLAVSGLHVGIFYLFLSKLLGRFSDKIRISWIIILLSFYAMLTGCAPSVLRAIYMIIILMIAPLVNRRYDPLSAISIVALILLIDSPLLVFHVGFQLSFGAALAIVLLYKNISERLYFLPEFWARSIAVIISAQIGTIPIIAYHFNFVSLSAFFINIPIVIIVGYIIPLGMLIIPTALIFYPLSVFLGKLLYILLKAMIGLTGFVSAIPMMSIRTISPNIFFIFFYYILLFIISMEKTIPETIWLKKRKVICIWMIAVYISICGINYWMPQNAQIIFLDVGQGDCTIIRTPDRKTILIDGGGNRYLLEKGFEIGEDVLIPFLLRNGITRIDMMFLSHPHYDHIGGLLSVLSHLKVGAVFRGVGNYENEDLETMERICKANNTKIYPLRKGESMEIEKDIKVDVLFPMEDRAIIQDEQANNNSLVFLMNIKGLEILFTGDIERETEMRLIKLYPRLRTDVLKAAHHGSKTSNTDEFIKLIRPDTAIIQVGKNHFGHPSEEVLNRFEQNNISTFRNDKNGAVIFKISKKNIKVKTMQ